MNLSHPESHKQGLQSGSPRALLAHGRLGPVPPLSGDISQVQPVRKGQDAARLLETRPSSVETDGASRVSALTWGRRSDLQAGLSFTRLDLPARLNVHLLTEVERRGGFPTGSR